MAETSFLVKTLYGVLYLTCTVSTVKCQNAIIFAPSNFTLNIDGLEIRCQPNEAEFYIINAITLKRNTSETPYNYVVSVGKENENDTGSVKWTDTKLQKRATAIGNLSSPSTANLIFRIEANNTQCDDEAIYTCVVTGLDNSYNPVSHSEVNRYVSLIVRDRISDIIVTPQSPKSSHYNTDINITMTCTITTDCIDAAWSINWCFMRYPYFISTKAIEDDNLMGISQDILQDSGKCQCQHTSTIIYSMSILDIETHFICGKSSLDNNTECEIGSMRSNTTVKREQTTKLPSDTSSSSDTTGVYRTNSEAQKIHDTTTHEKEIGANTTEEYTHSNTSGFGVHIVISVVVGGTVVLFAIAIFIAILVSRKKNSQHKYCQNIPSKSRTKESNQKELVVINITNAGNRESQQYCTVDGDTTGETRNSDEDPEMKDEGDIYEKIAKQEDKQTFYQCLDYT